MSRQLSRSECGHRGSTLKCTHDARSVWVITMSLTAPLTFACNAQKSPEHLFCFRRPSASVAATLLSWHCRSCCCEGHDGTWHMEQYRLQCYLHQPQLPLLHHGIHQIISVTQQVVRPRLSYGSWLWPASARRLLQGTLHPGSFSIRAAYVPHITARSCKPSQRLWESRVFRHTVQCCS